MGHTAYICIDPTDAPASGSHQYCAKRGLGGKRKLDPKLFVPLITVMDNKFSWDTCKTVNIIYHNICGIIGTIGSVHTQYVRQPIHTCVERSYRVFSASFAIQRLCPYVMDWEKRIKQPWRYAADWLAGPQCQNSIQTLSDTQWSNKCRLQFSTMQELQSARCYTRSIQPNATFHSLSHESIICVVPPLVFFEC